MNSNKRVKVAVGVFAVATTLGLAASGAFTAGGLGITDPTTPGYVGGFVGGNVSQTIDGAVISAITYDIATDGSNIEGVHITTDAPRGKIMTINFTGGTTDTASWGCTENAGAAPSLFDCVVTNTGTGGARSVDVTGLDITVR